MPRSSEAPAALRGSGTAGSEAGMSVETPGPRSKQGPQDISARTAEQGGWSHPKTWCWARRAGRAGAQAAGEGRTTEDALKDAASLVAPSPRGEASHCTELSWGWGFGAMWLCQAARAQRRQQGDPAAAGPFLTLLIPNYRKGPSTTFPFTPSVLASSGKGILCPSSALRVVRLQLFKWVSTPTSPFPTSRASSFKTKPPACPRSSRSPAIPFKWGCFTCDNWDGCSLLTPLCATAHTDLYLG